MPKTRLKFLLYFLFIAALTTCAPAFVEASQKPRLFIFAVNVNKYVDGLKLGTTEKAIVRLLPSLQTYAGRIGVDKDDIYYRIFDQSRKGETRNSSDPLYKRLDLPDENTVGSPARIEFKDPNYPNIVAGIKGLPRSLNTTDTVIFYISTHGINDDRLPLFALSGFDPKEKKYTSMDLKDIFEAFGMANTTGLGKLYFFIDACQNNLENPYEGEIFTADDGRMSWIVNKYVEGDDVGGTKSIANNIILVSSTYPGELSYIKVEKDGDGVGYFTHGLAEALAETRKGAFTASELVDKVKDKIEDAREKNDQRPQVWTVRKRTVNIYEGPPKMKLAFTTIGVDQKDTDLSDFFDETLEEGLDNVFEDNAYIFNLNDIEIENKSDRFKNKYREKYQEIYDISIRLKDSGSSSSVATKTSPDYLTDENKKIANNVGKLKIVISELKLLLSNNELASRSDFDYFSLYWVEKKRNGYVLTWLWLNLDPSLEALKSMVRREMKLRDAASLTIPLAEDLGKYARLDTGRLHFQSIFVSCYDTPTEGYLKSNKKMAPNVKAFWRTASRMREDLPGQIRDELKTRGISQVDNFTRTEYINKCSNFGSNSFGKAPYISSDTDNDNYRFVLHGQIDGKSISQAVHEYAKDAGLSKDPTIISSLVSDFLMGAEISSDGPKKYKVIKNYLSWLAVNQIVKERLGLMNSK